MHSQQCNSNWGRRGMVMAWGCMEKWVTDRKSRRVEKQKGVVQNWHRTPPRDLNPTFPIRGGGDRANAAASLGTLEGGFRPSASPSV